MGLLGKIFGKREPAPACEVDLADSELVREEDHLWWSTLAAADFGALVDEDNVFKIMLFQKLTRDDRLTEDEALERVRKQFPVYYLHTSDRLSGVGFLGEDAKLPYLLKERVNVFVNSVLLGEPGLLEKATSFNSMVRQMARSGRL